MMLLYWVLLLLWLLGRAGVEGGQWSQRVNNGTWRGVYWMAFSSLL